MRPITILAFTLTLSGAGFAQEQMPHKFWDSKNLALFSGVAASRIADVDSTWRFRAIRCEYHPSGYLPNGSRLPAYSVCGPAAYEGVLPSSLVDNKPGFASYSISMIGTQVLASYMLHRTGHHRLERGVSLLHIVVVGMSAAQNYRIACKSPIPQTVTRLP